MFAFCLTQHCARGQLTTNWRTAVLQWNGVPGRVSDGGVCGRTHERNHRRDFCSKILTVLGLWERSSEPFPTDVPQMCQNLYFSLLYHTPFLVSHKPSHFLFNVLSTHLPYCCCSNFFRENYYSSWTELFDAVQICSLTFYEACTRNKAQIISTRVNHHNVW